MTSKIAVLVTGGAGYIGAHTAKALYEQGYLPVAFDNLSSGHRQAVQWGPLVHGDIRDPAALREALDAHSVEAVIHLAGLIEVGRSMTRPDQYFDVNVVGLKHLLDAMRDRGVARLVFSSSAAVYGGGPNQPMPTLSESASTAPTSCYGETKLIGERMIADYCRAFDLQAVALRYFNAAGADPSGRIGEAHDPETHLIPLAIAAALGRGADLTVYGADFPTSDGSCLRDYIHVSDLAAAHVLALQTAPEAGAFAAINVGTGIGKSVFEVLEAVGAAVGRPVPHAIGDRRAGDPASLVADPTRASGLLSWRARRSDLSQIVGDALQWHRAPAFGPGPGVNPAFPRLRPQPSPVTLKRQA